METDVDVLRWLCGHCGGDVDRLIAGLDRLLDAEDDATTAVLGPPAGRLHVALLVGVLRRWRDEGADLLTTMRECAWPGFYAEDDDDAGE